MTTSQSLLAAAFLAPVLGSLLLPLAGRISERLRDAAALLCVLAALGCAAALAPVVLAGETVTLEVGGIGLLHADRLAVFMALVSTALGAVIVAYSTGYVAHLADRARRGEYYLVVVLFIGAMMGLVFARHLLFLYGCWEVTAVACWRLVAFFREERIVRAADKAFLVTALGAAVMLLGFVAIFVETGTFDLGKLAGAPISALATGLVLAGLFSKSATLPLHSWLPDAGVAPSPVTALLHAAVLVKIGVYVYARLFGATFVMDPGWQAAVPWIAAASALVAGAAALLESDLKRIIAYSTIGQLGFIFLGLSIGGPTAAGGALLFIAAHAVAKAGLFLCAGLVEHAAHTRDVRQLGGLARRMPVTGAAFALCALSVMGLPPFAGFYAKHLVVEGAFAAGQPALGLAFVAASALTVLYLGRAFALVFLGDEGAAVRGQAIHEGTPVMVGSVALLAALALAGGIFIGGPAALAAAAAADLVRLPGALEPGLGAAGLFHAGGLVALAAALLAISRPARAGTAGRAALRALTTLAVAELVLLAGAGLLEAAAPGTAAATAGLALLAAGGAARLGASPFDGWVADAAEASPPVTVAVVLGLAKVAGAALLARAAAVHGLGLEPGVGRFVLLGLGALSIVVGVAYALVQQHPRRRVAHLSTAHGGLVLLAAGAGLPSLALALGTAGAVVVALALVFLARGTVAARPAAAAGGALPSGGALTRRLRRAERSLEPGRMARGAVEAGAVGGFAFERAVNALYDVVAGGIVKLLAAGSRRAHDGRHARYLLWSMLGLAGMVLFLVGGR